MASSGSDGVGFDFKAGFLEGLTHSERKVVLSAGLLRRFVAKSVITHQSTAADRLFLLTNGHARYFFTTPDGRKVILFSLLPGDVFGGAALLSKQCDYHVSAETVKDSRVVVWDRNTIRTLAARYPRLLENALSTASDYLTWYVATHLGLTSHDARSRLAYILSNLSLGIGREAPRGRELELTNEELAQAANLTEFTVSRLLSEWQRRGAVVKRRGKVLIRSYEKLFLHSA